MSDERKLLDITKILTVADLDAVKWEDYLFADGQWLKYIEYPLSQREMSRVSALSSKSDLNIIGNSMGDMYYSPRLQTEMKGL